MKKEEEDVRRREEEVWQGEQGEKVVLNPWKNQKKYLMKDGRGIEEWRR
jgi:hypothetical protein